METAEEKQSLISLSSFEKSHVCDQIFSSSSNCSCFSLQKSLFVEDYVTHCVKHLKMCHSLQDGDSPEVQREHNSMQRG